MYIEEMHEIQKKKKKVSMCINLTVTHDIIRVSDYMLTLHTKHTFYGMLELICSR